ncbi:MAG TPA: DUF4397 domain-containing protein [Sphingobacteriaceae bacterium]
MKIFSIISIISLFTVFLFSGCDKEGVKYSDYELVDPNQSFLKVNYNIAFKSNPFVQLKINGTRVSGTNIQTRYPFPGGGFNTLGGSTGDYLPLKPGSNEISLSIPKNGTSIDSVNIYTTTIQTEVGKRYSLHLADSLNTKHLLVDEDVSLPDTNSVRYRFVNLMANVPAIDLYNGTVKVASNIPFMGISDKFVLSTYTSTSPGWFIRAAGASPTSTAIATYSSNNTKLNQRVYTVFATGYTGLTDAARKPYVAFYYVR